MVNSLIANLITISSHFKNGFLSPLGHLQIYELDQFFAIAALHKEEVIIDYIDIKE